MDDPILYWNAVALEANRVDITEVREQSGPTLSSRALAIVHLAMYDAYAGTASNVNLHPYLVSAQVMNASPEAAVAAAAHATLRLLYLSQREFLDQKLAEAGLKGPNLAAGWAHGLKVAEAIWALRKDDPRAEDQGWSPSMAPEAHRVDPDNPGQGFHAPFYGARSRLFAATKRHGLLSPSNLTAAEKLAAHKQVREKGALVGGTRTPEETLIGQFWAYDGAAELGTPPRLYNQIARQIAIEQRNDPARNARLFALVNVAMGDAGILAWEQKYIHNYWRPVLGIREYDGSMGPTGAGGPQFSDHCDPEWLPLGAPASNTTAKNFTPNFPAYPSGHATFGAAAFEVLRLFYEGELDFDDTKIEFVSDELNGRTRDNRGTVRPRHVRRFPGGLNQMIEENGRSRVFLGVHWVYDAFVEGKDGKPDLTRQIGGAHLGLAIARDIVHASEKPCWGEAKPQQPQEAAAAKAAD